MKLHGKSALPLVQISLELLGYIYFCLSPLVLASELFNVINSLTLCV